MDDDTPAAGDLPAIYPRNPPVNLPRDPSYLRPSNLWAFEGLDGSGKSTLVSRVIEACQDRGRKARRLNLNGSDLLSHALERAKWCNVDPMAFNLLNWVSLFDQTTALEGALNAEELLFFDRYSLTVKIRGVLEGLDTDFMDRIEENLCQPVGIFLIDCAPETCLKRILSGGREISYFEAGIRDTSGVGEPMMEHDPSVRLQGVDRRRDLLDHLNRMSQAYKTLGDKYDNLHVINNEGEIGASVEAVLSIIGLPSP